MSLEGSGDQAKSDLGQRDRLLQKALRPILRTTIVETFQSQSHTMVESLYPLVGKAVRRSVRESLRALAESIDGTMRNALTFKRLRWKLKAHRQGVTVASLILRESIVYRVEEVFCIHGETGLMVHHSGQRADESRDLVSGMFSAIQDFVTESFRDEDEKEDELDSLDRFQVGEHDVWLIHGPRAYLAVVISGEAPSSLRDDFYVVLESIHENFGQQLKDFDGDPEKFSRIGLWLEDCMVERKRDTEKKSLALFGLLAGIVGLALVFVAWSWFQHRTTHQQIAKQLADTPGVVVNSARKGWQHSSFDLLVDPGAQEAVDRIQADHADHCQFHQASFLSLDLPAIQQRLTRQWQRFAKPGDDFEIVVEEPKGSLAVRGKVSHAWLIQAQAASAGVGVPIEFADVRDRDRLAFAEMASTLTSVNVGYLSGQLKVGPEDSPKWPSLAKQMQAMLKLAKSRGYGVSFELYAVPAGDLVDEAMIALAEARTQQARGQLYAQGIALDVLSAKGLLPLDAHRKLPQIPTPGSVLVVPLFLSPSSTT